MELAPGVVLVGRYRLERKIGEGGMGAVWVGKNMSVGTDVAIKTLKLDAAANSEIVMRFRREAYLLACVRSDHVCRVLDFASDERYGHVLVLDFIRGQPLSDLLAQRRLTVEEALEIGTDVARGMFDLHQANIVHRDLKPGNILLEPRPDGHFRALIVDFGLGRRIRPEEDMQSGITSMDVALGTLEYMSPEQIINSRGATHVADIYALGAMLYRAVVGRHMFGELTSVQLAQAKLGNESPPFKTGRADPLAQRFEAIVTRAIQKKVQDRYQTTEELLNDLRALHRQREVRSPQTMALPAQAPMSGPPMPPSAPPHGPGSTPAPFAPPQGAQAMPVAAPLQAPAAAPAPSAPPALGIGASWAPAASPAATATQAKAGHSTGALVAAALVALVVGAAAGAFAEHARLEAALKAAAPAAKP
ncbi:MAG TPA: serine/threonine-protein kinase [Byssovorax sp.]|jgi:serine/threonine-protein kinase